MVFLRDAQRAGRHHVDGDGVLDAGDTQIATAITAGGGFFSSAMIPGTMLSTAACMTLSDSIHVMLLTRDKFAGFTPLPIADAKAGTQVLLCLSSDSRESVDTTVERAVAAGGTADPAPKQDYGVMYGRSVADPDGHIWEIMWMDAAAAEQGASAVEAAMATADRH